MTTRITRGQLGRIIREEATKLHEAPARYRERGRQKKQAPTVHGSGLPAVQKALKYAAETLLLDIKQRLVDDQVFDPRFGKGPASKDELDELRSLVPMADGIAEDLLSLLKPKIASYLRQALRGIVNEYSEAYRDEVQMHREMDGSRRSAAPRRNS